MGEYNTLHRYGLNIYSESIFIHHDQYLKLEKTKLSDYLKLLDESLIGYGDEKEKGKLIRYESDGKGNIKEVRELVKEKGNIIGKGVGQFHHDIKEVDKGTIFGQSNDAPKFKIDEILGISKDTPIIELIEEVFRDYKPAPFGLCIPSNKQGDKRIDNTIQNFCEQKVQVPLPNSVIDIIQDFCYPNVSKLLQETHEEYEKGIKKITGTIQDFCKECVVDYHKVNKNISPYGSEQLTEKVFEDLLKQDPKTGKRNIVTVRNEIIFNIQGRKTCRNNNSV